MTWRKLKTWYTRLRDDAGHVKKISLGTTHKKTAERMEVMFAALREQGDGWVINALVRGDVTPLRVMNAVAEGRAGLDALRRELEARDLSVFAEPWAKWASRHVGAETLTRYSNQVQTLFSLVGTSSRELTRPNISTALLDMDVSGTTGKHYHAAWSSFFTYLVEVGAVENNPMRSIKAPKPNPPKDLWLELADVIRLVDAHDEPYRSLAAFREGAGVEVSAALRVRVRDVNVEKHTIRARGTKTLGRAAHTRDRLVRVDAWAWSRVLGAVQGKHPDALVWPVVAGQDVDEAALKLASAAVYRAHKLARKALPDLPAKYTVHDARHSYAVRHVKAGDQYEVIAHQLGHKDASQVIKVYGKYRPSDAEVEGAAPVAAPAPSHPTLHQEA